MFVYSLRASTLKFFAFLLLSIGLLVGIVIWGRSEAVAVSVVGEVNLSGVKTNEQRVEFLEGFGLIVDKEPTEQKSFRLPTNFDRVTNSYNEIQKSQGLDISKYKGKKLTVYSYKVNNFKEGDAEAYAHLFVYRSRIVACDVSYMGDGGKVYPLMKLDASLVKK